MKKSKGQIFATDFLIAMVIIILGFGLIAAASEYTLYQNKEQTNYKILQEKAETTAITLANSDWADCGYGVASAKTEAAYSINLSNVNNLTPPDKKNLAISGYPAKITLTKAVSGVVTTMLDDGLANSKNIAITEINVMWCTNAVTYAELKACMQNPIGNNCSTANIGKGTLKVMVGE